MKNHPTRRLLALTVGVSGVLTLSDCRAADDLFQDAGSWLRVAGEGSLKVVDPGLQNVRVWLEGQARYLIMGSLFMNF